LIKKKSISTFGEIYDYIEALLRFKPIEEFHIIGISVGGEVVADRCIAKGNIKMVGIEMREISLFVSTYKVPAVIFVHNHPNGSCVPSKQDFESSEKLEGMFKFAGCKMIDNLVVGSDGIYSIQNNQYRRKFIVEEGYYNFSFAENIENGENLNFGNDGQ
jgi:DNA repair protein RadC